MMNRLAVFRLKRDAGQLLLVLSDPEMALAGTVVAAPLKDVATFPVAGVLNPIVEIGQTRLALATEQLAAIPARELGEQVTVCTEHEYAIASALNRLFFGI